MILTVNFYLKKGNKKLFLTDLPVQVFNEDFHYQSEDMKKAIERILEDTKNMKRFSLVGIPEGNPNIVVEIKFPTEVNGHIYDSYKIGMTVRNIVNTLVSFSKIQ